VTPILGPQASCFGLVRSEQEIKKYEYLLRFFNCQYRERNALGKMTKPKKAPQQI